MQPNEDQKPEFNPTEDATMPKEELAVDASSGVSASQPAENTPGAPGAPGIGEVVQPDVSPASAVVPDAAPEAAPVADEVPVASGTAAPEQPVIAPPAGLGAPINPSTKGGKKKLLLVSAIAGGILLLGGGVAAAYYAVVLPNQPQRITADAIGNSVNIDKVKTASFEGEVSFEGGEVSKALSSVAFNGSSDGESGAFDLAVKLKTAVAEVGLDVKTTDSKSYYVRLSGLDGLDKLIAASMGASADAQTSALISQQVLPIIQAVNNNWYAIDESLVKQATGDSVPSFEQQRLSSEDAQKIKDAYKANQFLNVNKRLDDQDIKGQGSYHVEAAIDNAKLKGFLEAVKNANIDGLKIEQSQIDDITKADLSQYPFELWVSKKDRLITQIATSIKKDETTYKVRVAMFDYNKEVKVEKPADAKSILELMGELSPLMGGGVLGTNTEGTLPLGLTL